MRRAADFARDVHQRIGRAEVGRELVVLDGDDVRAAVGQVQQQMPQRAGLVG